MPQGDDLEGLLRGGGDPHERKPEGAGSKRSTAPQPELSSLLEGGKMEIDLTRTVRTDAPAGQGLPSLESALGNSGASAVTKPASARSQNAVQQGTDSDLDALLRPSQGASKSKVASRKAVVSGDQALDAVLETGASADDRQDLKAGATQGLPRVSRGLVAGLGSALMLLVVAVVWFGQHGRITVPDSEVARQLMKVVEGVETFRASNHILPAKLSMLKQFPSAGVEFDMSQYDIRLATPKLEFFYVAVGTDYYVVARYADEAWAYKGEPDPQLTRADAR